MIVLVTVEPALSKPRTRSEQDQRIVEAIRQERPRLWNFLRRRVAEEEVEDILQEVFSELIEAYRLMKPIEEVGAWLFRVARNRVIDRFRKKRPEPYPVQHSSAEGDADILRWEDSLPSPDAGPDAVYARRILLEEIAIAVDELPKEQRDVFIAHEIEGRSFKDMAAETGISINTLLSRKHYAVVFLRRRLQAIYDEFRGS